jgi:hypothetical protein
LVFEFFGLFDQSLNIVFRESSFIVGDGDSGVFGGLLVLG